jgi:hypothetical protein
MQVRRGDDPRLAALPWDSERTLEVSTGASDGHQLVSVSHAFAASPRPARSSWHPDRIIRPR